MPRWPSIRNLTRSALPALALALPCWLSGAAAHAETPPLARPAPAYTGNYIVRWRSPPAADDGSADADNMRHVLDATGIALSVKRHMAGQLQLLTPAEAGLSGISGTPGIAGADPEAIAATLRKDPRIADAVPDRLLRLHDTLPNDPEFGVSQPYLQAPSVAAGGVNLPKAWDRSRGSSGIVIAVLDTGILAHPDLDGRVVAGYDVISNTSVANDGGGRDADPSDPGDNIPATSPPFVCPDGSQPAPANSSWHGTRVAGVIGAVTDNGLNTAGVDWNARLLPVRVSGRCGALLSDAVDGMRWAGGLPVPGAPVNGTPARVINISLGGGSCSSIEQQAIDDLAAAGVVVVAATGNDRGPVEAPADCRGVVSVTAHVNDGESASYADIGPQVTLSAPGGGCGVSKMNGSSCTEPVSVIRTLSNSGQTSPGAFTVTSSAGTSFAAPMVSGVIGLMLALQPAMTPTDIVNALKTSARPHPAGTYCAANQNMCGAGLLDADAALSATAPATTAAQAPAPVAGSSGTGGDGGGDGGGGGAWSLQAALVLLCAGAIGFVTRRRPPA